MTRTIATLALIASAFLLGGAVPMPAAEIQLSKQEVKDLVANAKTPADHLKLAAWYNAEAANLEAEAQEHELSADANRGRGETLGAKGPMNGRTAGHCDYFARTARETASNYRSLAAGQLELASGK